MLRNLQNHTVIAIHQTDVDHILAALETARLALGQPVDGFEPTSRARNGALTIGKLESLIAGATSELRL